MKLTQRPGKVKHFREFRFRYSNVAGEFAGRETALGSINRSAVDAIGFVVAGGFAGQAIAANHEFTLKPHLVILIRRLLLLKAVFWLNLASWFGRGSVEWTEDDFTFRARVLFGSKLERLGVVRGGGAKPVPRDRISPRGGTTVSRRTAICQHQRGDKECNAFRNHGDHSRQSEKIGEKPTLARRHELVQVTLKSRAAQGQPS